MINRMFILWLMIFASTAVANSQVETHAFKARLNSKIAVEVVFQTTQNDGEWMTAGYIYYPKAKAPAPILIVKNWGKEKPVVSDKENVFNNRFVEYQSDGEMTGILYLTYAEVEGDFQMMNGSWKNPTTVKVMRMTDFVEMPELPNWWPGTPAVLNAPKREAWKFLYRLYNDDNEDTEWLNTIAVTVEVNGKKHPLSFEDSLNGAVSSSMEEKLEWVTEEDINFDGLPDVMVYLGVTTRAQSLYKAFVWNPVTRQYYPVKAFEEIQEPFFDSKAKTIESHPRDFDGFYIETYKWKNGILKQISSKKVIVSSD